MGETLGEFLQKCRQERNLSLRGLEKLTGVAYASLHKIENGTVSRPKAETLEQLARGLKVPYEALDRLARGLPAEPRPSDTGISLEQGMDHMLACLYNLPIPSTDKDYLRTMILKYLERFERKQSD